ncbi:MAG: GntR family transcriptional regulator [Nakamurella sp.]
MSADLSAQVDLFAPSLVEATTRRLRDEILSGAIEPGARLIEEQICQRFSISRAPLRESLRLLVQQGLVEHLPRRGARVTVWSDEDIRQLFEIRAVLERHAMITALPLVAAAPGVDPLALVRDRLEQMRVAEASLDELERDDAHRAFHAAIVALAGNRQLDLAMEPILVKLQRPMAVNLRLEASLVGPGEGLRRHAALLSALETNDVDIVLAALQEHGGQRYLQYRQDGSPISSGS